MVEEEADQILSLNLADLIEFVGMKVKIYGSFALKRRDKTPQDWYGFLK